MTDPVILAAPLVLLAVGLLVLAVDRLAVRVVRPTRRPPGRTPADLELDFEDVVVPAEHPLRGWLVKPSDDRGGPVVVMTHGWGANAGVLVELAGALARSGTPTLIFDLRGHGRSARAPWVTVRHARDDARAAAEWMTSRFPRRPLALAGHSMGGAAVTLAAAEGTAAAGVALLAAPADVLEVVADYIARRGMPGRLLVWLFRPSWRLRVGEPYDRLVPERRIPGMDAAFLVVQPEEDDRVPREHARRLAEATGTKAHVVEGTDHGSVLGHPETIRLVTGFVEGLASAPGNREGG